jgi:glycerol-3-phosphate dehydrogenase
VTLLAYQQWIGDIPIISASKGIESESLMYMSQLVPDVLKKQHPMAFLSGPSFAKELVEEQPTAGKKETFCYLRMVFLVYFTCSYLSPSFFLVVVVASESDALCSAVQNIFLSPRLRVYTSNDVIGTEVGGALKNVIAIGAGICAGMNLGLNTMAMLITRGTSEMMKLALRMGAQPTTLSGLSGIGDLILTCYGPLSRNRTVGKLLGEGKTMEEVAKLQVEVAEGVFTAAAAAKLCEKLNLDLPIIQAIAAVLAGNISAQDAVKKLMMIPVGPELATVFVTIKTNKKKKKKKKFGLAYKTQIHHWFLLLVLSFILSFLSHARTSFRFGSVFDNVSRFHGRVLSQRSRQQMVCFVCHVHCGVLRQQRRSHVRCDGRVF